MLLRSTSVGSFILVSLLAVACGDDTGSGGAATTATGATGVTSVTSPAATGATSSKATGSASGGQTSGSASSGNAIGCDGASFAICEDFEDTADGAFPDGFGARGDEWGDNATIGVASDDAKHGQKSLKVDGGNNGQHFMEIKTPLGALASHHYGRVYMKVATPAPWPQGGVLHADFIEGLGPNAGGGTHNVRWGVVENTDQKFQWIYNVQPDNAGEWADGTGYDYDWPGTWQCIEWYYDEPSQEGTLWIDGDEIPIDVGGDHPPEIPVFESLGVGLANYQPAGEGFTVWFDDLAYDADRIGCDP